MSLIQLLNVTGEGFLTFFDPFEFKISDYEGKAVQIDGLNKTDELAQSNGSGKSSLIESLAWGWYGELCRKNRYKDEVIYNRNGVKAKEATVSTFFYIEKHKYQTTRTIKWKGAPDLFIQDHSGEVLNGATYQTKQVYLENILGMNFTAFQCSTIFGGPTSSFLCFPDLKPSERATVLTDIRGLERYVKASKVCSDTVKIKEFAKNGLERDKQGIDGRISQLRELDYKDQIQGFEDDRKKEIGKLELMASEVKKNLEEAKKKSKEAIGKITDQIKQKEKLLKEKEGMLEGLQELEDKLGQKKEDLASIRATVKSMEGRTDELIEELDSFKKMKSGKCPKCKQTITGEHLKKELRLMTEEIDNRELEISKKNREIEEVLFEIKALNDKRSWFIDIQNKNLDIKTIIFQLKIDATRLQTDPETQKHMNTLSQLQISIQGRRGAENPYLQQEEDRKTQLFGLVAKNKALKTEIEGLEEDVAYQQFWSEGFKKIRLSLFNSMIENFQYYAQNLLSQYSTELQIQFSTERETRSGTTKDEFTILITDSSGTALSYEMYSGGEKQKVRLAIAMALAQMVKDDCGKDLNFICFDEPNDSLDDLGKGSNFSAFSELAEGGKAIFVTDHDETFKERFDETILVVKENDKSYIQMEVNSHDK